MSKLTLLFHLCFCLFLTPVGGSNPAGHSLTSTQPNLTYNEHKTHMKIHKKMKKSYPGHLIWFALIL